MSLSGNFKGNLTIPIQSIYEGKKYPCDWCDYQATAKHKESIHEGKKYPCDSCDHVTIQKESKHKD